VAVDFHLPQGPGCEPVVIVAIEDHRRIVANTGIGHQLFKDILRNNVALHGVAKLHSPVPGNRA
jgi:hypothetical protein